VERGERMGTYIVSYYGELEKHCNEIEIYIKRWSELNAPNTEDFKYCSNCYKNIAVYSNWAY